VVGDRLGNQAGGIGEVDDPGIGRVAFDQACLFDGDGHGAQGHGSAGRTSGFLAGKAVLDGDAFIGGAAGDAADADRVHHERSAFDRVLDTGCLAHDQIAAFGADDGAAQRGHDRQAIGIGIPQHQFARAQRLRGIVDAEVTSGVRTPPPPIKVSLRSVVEGIVAVMDSPKLLCIGDAAKRPGLRVERAPVMQPRSRRRRSGAASSSASMKPASASPAPVASTACTTGGRTWMISPLSSARRGRPA
jgi:hypothetical protein